MRFNFPHPWVKDRVTQQNNDALKVYLDKGDLGFNGCLFYTSAAQTIVAPAGGSFAWDYFATPWYTTGGYTLVGVASSGAIDATAAKCGIQVTRAGLYRVTGYVLLTAFPRDDVTLAYVDFAAFFNVHTQGATTSRTLLYTSHQRAATASSYNPMSAGPVMPILADGYVDIRLQHFGNAANTHSATFGGGAGATVNRNMFGLERVGDIPA